MLVLVLVDDEDEEPPLLLLLLLLLLFVLVLDELVAGANTKMRNFIHRFIDQILSIKLNTLRDFYLK